ncbi:PREDICTED: 28S ribosomal protein S35, mitochondrial [Nicrophorus vespilloides]|uniref:28S ribosomal protein S35, mitochondrial n=1 Tax=Nicrophorus vespilloides TaxID=110193 RepID=A0ABM1N9R8_NICVS|nr:PREDICTED: 28S ribosomal protein S35, mitochondrial [Nicrophorus vespilloides]
MSVITRILDKNVVKQLPKRAAAYYSNKPNIEEDIGEFRVLYLKTSKAQAFTKKKYQKPEVLPPRSNEMPVDQNWGNVWPGPRTFHPATVPLPLRQGYVSKGSPPDKYANAELMKIPNFLHLTPPVIERQCAALKKFCTPWPKALSNDELCEKHFPFEVISSNYCHSSPSIRDPMARIVTIKFKLNDLKFDEKSRDKYLRLVGDRYNSETGYVTIVTDRCPTQKQNYDYAMYLVTALYHESWNVEAWEELKTEADMEKYIWENNESKKSVEKLFGKNSEDIAESKQYANAVINFMNEGESDYTLANYGDSVRILLGLPAKTNVL